MQHQISDKRRYHLAYCKICHYRDYNTAKGIICHLTKDVANFEKECPSIRLDFESLDDWQAEVHNEVSEYVQEHFEIDSFFRKNYIKPTHSFTSKYHTTEKTHHLKFRAISHNNIWTHLSFIGLIVSSTGIFISEQNVYKLLFGLVMFVSICALIIRMVIDYHTPKKVLFSTDEKGFVLNDTPLYWHDVIDFRILKSRNKRHTSRCLLIGFISQDVQLFDITNVKITNDELLEIFHRNRKDYFTRHQRNMPDTI